MLRFDHTDRVIHAVLEGTVTRDDLLPFYETLNAALDDGGRLGLVIDFAGLSDMTADAIVEDARRELALLPRLRRIPRVAVISNKEFMAALVRWTDPLVPTTELRVFASGEDDLARAWVAQAPQLAQAPRRRDGLREIPTDEADVVAFEIDGPFDGNTLDPIIARIDALVDRGTGFDMLARVKRFEGFDPRLLTRSGLFSMKVNAIRHLDRYAIVTDARWLRTMARAVADVMPMEVRVFTLEQEPEAWAWLRCRAARETG
ncbi:SpoIIAA family protein [Halovulum sp. GXIMD14794]